MARTCAALLLALAAGCSALNFTEAECRGMNWQQRGYADGFGGHPPQDLRLARECGRFGVPVAESEYFAGWRAGHDEWYRLMGSVGLD
jgi:Protein of unknown function (DUF2799)